MNIETQKELLDLLITAEARCEALYGRFADSMAEHRGLWTRMAGEEKRHAAVLKALRGKIAAGEASFGQGELRAEAMRMFLDYVDAMAKEVSGGRMTPERALGITVDIERSYVERKVLDHFEGDTPAVAEALKVLRDESFRHVADAELAWLAARRA
ncbi:MAG TPA: hypothetical protein VGK27_08780 [Candidatus Deferrimicrobiaceae bacterium]|jgi:rubrerythrin